MPYYHVNRQPLSTGEHEVHENTCIHRPEPASQVHMGFHSDSDSAVDEAKRNYTKVDACQYCCKPFDEQAPRELALWARLD